MANEFIKGSWIALALLHDLENCLQIKSPGRPDGMGLSMYSNPDGWRQFDTIVLHKPPVFASWLNIAQPQSITSQQEEVLLDTYVRHAISFGPLDLLITLEKFAEKFLREPAWKLAHALMATNQTGIDVVAPLPLPRGMDMAERITDTRTGRGLRFTRFYDISQNSMLSQVDMLFGQSNNA